MVTLKLYLNCWPLKVSWWKLSKCAGATSVRKWRISTTKHCYWPVVTVSGKDPTAYMLGISLKIRHRSLLPSTFFWWHHRAKMEAERGLATRD